MTTFSKSYNGHEIWESHECPRSEWTRNIEKEEYPVVTSLYDIEEYEFTQKHAN